MTTKNEKKNFLKNVIKLLSSVVITRQRVQQNEIIEYAYDRKMIYVCLREGVGE